MKMSLSGCGMPKCSPFISLPLIAKTGGSLLLAEWPGLTVRTSSRLTAERGRRSAHCPVDEVPALPSASFAEPAGSPAAQLWWKCSAVLAFLLESF